LTKLVIKNFFLFFISAKKMAFLGPLEERFMFQMSNKVCSYEKLMSFFLTLFVLRDAPLINVDIKRSHTAKNKTLALTKLIRVPSIKNYFKV